MKRTNFYTYSLGDSVYFTHKFYDTYISKYHYAHNDTYKFEQFWQIIKEIDRFKIRRSILAILHKSLVSHGRDSSYRKALTPEKADKVIEQLLAGFPPVDQFKRKHRFDAVIKKYPYDVTIRLNKLWRIDLKKILEDQSHERSVFENRHKLVKNKPTFSASDYERLLVRLRMDTRTTLSLIATISRDFRSSLRQMYRHQKVRKRNLNTFTDSEIIVEYLKKYLPETVKARNWMKTFKKYVYLMNDQKERYEEVKLELTFLDKNVDVFRCLRFPDATANCLNTHLVDPVPIRQNALTIFHKPMQMVRKMKQLLEYYTYGLSPLKSLAKIYSDPLTFIMDLKKAGSNQIIGFVFGRIAIDTTNHRPVIMLNNIYTVNDDAGVVKSILTIIEKYVGGYIKAEAIILPLFHTSDRPLAGYQEQIIDIIPLVALKRRVRWLNLKIQDDFLKEPYQVNVPLRCKVNYKKILSN